MRVSRLAILLLVVAPTGAFAPTVHHPSRPPRRLALLIGISDYKNFQPDGPPGQSDLNGPANDVPRIKTSLRRYGFDGDSSVRVLLNAQASRQGITDGFRWLAQQATDTADVVVIFYSGHGSFTKDLNGDEALVTPGDTLDEALVPWDAMDIHDPAQLVIDDQIGDWLKALGTTNVTLIIDACFSGTATRGAEIAPVARPRGARGNTPSSSATAVDLLDNPAYTLITASSAIQVAMELPLGQDKKVFGVLTYYLTEALDAAGPNARYDEVMRDVVANVRDERVTQRPQLEGDRGARLFRMRGEVAHRAFALVTPLATGRVVLDVGVVNGVRRSALYDVFPPGETAFSGPPLGQVTVDSLEETRALASVSEGVRPFPAGARAVLARVPRGARTRDHLTVYLAPSAAAARPLLESMSFAQLTDSAHADAVVTARRGVLEVLVDGYPLPPLAVDSQHPAAWIAVARHGADSVLGYARSRAALCGPLTRAFGIASLGAIENPEAPFDLVADLRVVPSGTPAEARQEGAADTMYIGKSYDIFARVLAPETSLLYLSVAVEGYSADPWMVYPPQQGANRPIQLNTWVRILRSATPSEPAGVEVLKLVIDSDQFDFGSLLGALPRDCGLARGFNQAAPQPVTGWRALDHKLIILRRSP